MTTTPTNEHSQRTHACLVYHVEHWYYSKSSFFWVLSVSYPELTQKPPLALAACSIDDMVLKANTTLGRWLAVLSVPPVNPVLHIAAVHTCTSLTPNPTPPLPPSTAQPSPIHKGQGSDRYHQSQSDWFGRLFCYVESSSTSKTSIATAVSTVATPRMTVNGTDTSKATPGMMEVGCADDRRGKAVEGH
ncbi:hypothetical protein BDN70DRAFT_997910 [Pholiota conissans]|uniref:Uncharacterized protein n=1 Tax=Pholiota conissans TaxID=109636 RepID=A0A9P6CNK1_9AGAR|nr:hypothetical protein BDN70DRAFT_997910 [Pholiota conissans]